MRLIKLSILMLALFSAAALAEIHTSKHHQFKSVNLIENLAHPWSIAFLSGDDWLITERSGQLRHVQNGKLIEAPVTGTPDVNVENQAGLLDVVLHPDFADNQYVYLTYAKACSTGGNTTAVGRGVWNDGALEDFTELYEADACEPGGRHHGSRIVFDGDNYMHVSIGDRGVQDKAQDPTNNIGSILRLHDDGSIPEDNPFVGKAGHDANWTYGNRNPQGMAIHPSGEIWANEHGPMGGDELNVISKGANYGWPAITYGKEYNGTTITDKTGMDGMKQPLKQWTPSIAPSGMAFYTGDAFPDWQGDVFVGALAHTHVARLRFDGHNEVEEEKLMDNSIGRVRDVRVGPDGLVYILTDSPKGKLVRLEPAD